ncbi:hypothetical protein ACHAO4_003654 [Trichoderma viride]
MDETEAQRNERGRRDGEGEAERVKEEPWLKGGGCLVVARLKAVFRLCCASTKGQSPDTPTSGCASECLTGRSEEPSTRRGRASGKRWMTSAGALCLVRRPAQLGLSERVSAAKTLLRGRRSRGGRIKSSHETCWTAENEEEGRWKGGAQLHVWVAAAAAGRTCRVLVGLPVEAGDGRVSSRRRQKTHVQPKRRSRRSAWGLEIGALGRYKGAVSGALEGASAAAAVESAVAR